MTRFYLILACLVLLISGCNKSEPADNANNPEFPSQIRRANVSQPRTVAIASPDGVTLVGTFFESSEPKSPALLLLHQWQSDRHSFDDFAAKMQVQGFNVLAIDGRGFGESTKKADGSTVSAGRSDDDVKAMLSDVEAAFDFLSKQKNVDPDRMGIVGASYGSSLALIYAADHPNVHSVAALSPGINYFGNMNTEPAVKEIGQRPIFLAAANDDPDSADAVFQLETGTEGSMRGRTEVLTSGGHGTALLKNDAFEKSLIAFCKDSLEKKADQNKQQ